MLVYRVESRAHKGKGNVGVGPYNPEGADLADFDDFFRSTLNSTYSHRIHTRPIEDGISMGTWWEPENQNLVFGFHSFSRAKRWWQKPVSYAIECYGEPETFALSAYYVPDDAVVMYGDNPRQIAFDCNVAKFILAEPITVLV